MTRDEALAASQDKPLVFLKGNAGIEGWYARVFFAGRVHDVRHHGQWNYNTRDRAIKAGKRFAAAMQEAKPKG